MNKEELKFHIKNALNEDIKSGDITAELIDDDINIKATITLKESAVMCGFDCVFITMQLLSEMHSKPNPVMLSDYKDGDFVEKDSIIFYLEGNAKVILTGERTALNYMQTLSGISTVTKEYVDILNENNSKVKLLDTRKTIPSLRSMSKYAVLCGGGYNNRYGLYDAYLIKENHLMSCESITHAVNCAKKLNPNKFVEVEVETLSQLNEALNTPVNRIMLDNFDNDNIIEAIKRRNNMETYIELEVSGNISKDRLLLLRALDIDYISVGLLTKNIRAVDLSMKFQV